MNPKTGTVERVPLREFLDEKFKNVDFRFEALTKEQKRISKTQGNIFRQIAQCREKISHLETREEVEDGLKDAKCEEGKRKITVTKVVIAFLALLISALTIYNAFGGG